MLRALSIMTSTSLTSCSTLTKEWFEDSSSEDESHCVRRFKRGKQFIRAGASDKLNNKIELLVTVRIASRKVGPLRARVSRGLLKRTLNRSVATTTVESKSPTTSRSYSPTIIQSHKERGKKKVGNWRKRPVRDSARRPFRRTLPGELSRSIIVSRVSRDSSIPVTFGVSTATTVSVDITVDTDASGQVTSRRRAKAARKAIKEASGSKVGLLREHPSLSLASHTQVANVIVKCLPLHSVDPFLLKFNSFRPPPLQKRKGRTRKRKGATPSVPIPVPASALPPIVWCDETVCKTPIVWIDSALKHAFGDEHGMLKRCKHPDEMYGPNGESHSDLDVIVMDCVLSRSGPINLERESKDAAYASDAPVQVCSFHYMDAVNMEIAARDGHAFNYGSSGKHDDDAFYRACIVILPQAGVFYCHRERRSLSTGVLNSHVPMDINWLRLQPNSHAGNCFGKGSYVSRLASDPTKCSIWKWSIRRSATNLLPFPNAIVGLRPRSVVRSILCTKQLTDEEGPALPPDYIVGSEENELLNADRKSRIETYRDAFSRSQSAKLGGRHYAPGFLHKTIDPSTCYVIDSREHGELDLHVAVTIPGNGGAAAFHRTSIVQIRYLPNIVGSGCEELLMDINRHCQMVRKQRGGAGARAGNGDLGSMHPIGRRIDPSGKAGRYIASSTKDAVAVLSKSVQAMAKLASVTIPAALRVMQDFENDSGMHHVPGMDGDGGLCRVTHTMDLSINLANSSHVDVNDATQGFTIWTEDHPGTTEEWYFVLPNLTGKYPGTDRNYNGIAIKLTDGVLIGWDGRLIRHGTSMVGSRVGNAYGNFFAAKTRIITHGMSQLPNA